MLRELVLAIGIGLIIGLSLQQPAQQRARWLPPSSKTAN
jgi:hypothetical protein